MDMVVFFEGTITRGGKTKNKIIIYVPVDYHEKLLPFLGKRAKIIAIVER